MGKKGKYMTNTDVKTQTTNQLSLEDAKRYLTLYLGEGDWDRALKKLQIQLSRKYRNQNELKTKMREVISCAILLSKYDHVNVPPDPTVVLFWAQTPSNLTQRDWFPTLIEEMERDNQIERDRHIIAALGIIHPIDFSPITRQAFNWMYSKGTALGHIKPENKAVVEKKFKNLVSIYGGQVICNLFTKDTKTRPILSEVINWYSGYHVEKLIHKTYDLDSIIKIKNHELDKTNKDLIRSLTTK